MLAVSMKDIEKSYGITDVLEKFSFSINMGEKIALIGANGCGKTTVLKIIAGLEEYSQGSLSIKNGMNIGYLEQIPRLNPEHTIYEELKTVFNDLLAIEKKITELEEEISKSDKSDKKREQLMKEYSEKRRIFENMGGYKYRSDIYKIATGLGFKHEEMNKRTAVLSGGEKRRLGLVKLLLSKPDVLLLDEPTNHLDIPSRQWLEDYLHNYHGAVIIISHDRYFLDKVVNKIVELKDGKDELYYGNYSYYLRERKERYARRLQRYKNQQKEIKKMEESIKKLHSWGNRGDNAKLAKRAKSMEKSLERMEKIEKPTLGGKKMGLYFDFSKRSGDEVLKLKGIEKSFDDKKLLKDLDLNIYFGEKSAIIGKNGTGKTTILKIINEEIEADRGEIKIGASVKVGYYEQEFSGFNDDDDLVTALRREVIMTEGEARDMLASFLFTEDDVFKKVKNLSGGEKSRLRLLQLMNGDYNFLVLDEPTNHLDLPSREVLEKVLKDYSGTVLVVSHDRYFLNKIIDITYELAEGNLTKYYGNYEYYRNKKDDRNNEEEENITEEGKNKKDNQYLRWKKKKKKERKRKKEIKNLEDKIMELEEEQEKLEEEMAAPENVGNYLLLNELKEKYKNTRRELKRLYELWESYV